MYHTEPGQSVKVKTENQKKTSSKFKSKALTYSFVANKQRLPYLVILIRKRG